VKPDTLSCKIHQNKRYSWCNHYTNQGTTSACSFRAGGTSTPTTITTTKAVGVDESGTVFFINSATGFVTTLPAPTAGLRYTFINKTANTSGDHTIVTNASANIIKGNQKQCVR